MCPRIPLFLVLITLVAAVVPPARGDVTAKQVLDAIEGGKNFLLAKQHPTRGNWDGHTGQPGGMTALCVLALVNAGHPVDSKEIKLAIDYLKTGAPPKRTYAAAVQIMAMAAVDGDAHRVQIETLARWLEGSQIKTGPRAGAWAYSSNEGRGDNSNTQFALLALHEAERAGVPVDSAIWRRSEQHFRQSQSPQGGWNYYVTKAAPLPYTGSMTCAGISSMIIATGKLRARDAIVQGNQVICCGGSAEDDDSIERALQFLGRTGFFSLEGNPGTGSGSNWLYFLYGLERVGRLSGRRFIGGRDWYREGAERLVQTQRTLSKSSAWIGIGPVEGENTTLATCFALLFLSKGRRPVVLGKLKHGEDQRDWNLHRGAVSNLVDEVERSWKTYLTWQTIETKAATTTDLLEAPVLIISGSRPLQLAAGEKKALREYVEQGGFVLAEACDGNGCRGEPFAESFRKLMRELFPNSPLRPLPADHPIWFAERKVNFDDLPHGSQLTIEGLDSCCRTSVVLCNKTLTGYWELSTGRRRNDYPEDVKRQVEASLRLGQNILAYATNRQLKEKLERPQVAVSAAQQRSLRGLLSVAKLNHAGGAEEAPNALPNLLRESRRMLQMRMAVDTQLISPADPNLPDYPVLFMHGRRAFRFTPAERSAIREYLANGGFIIVNSICASPQFTSSVRREFAALADTQLSRIPPKHAMFTTEFNGFNLAQVSVRRPGGNGEPMQVKRQTPFFEGLQIEDRLCLAFTPLDMSCALQDQPSVQCEGYLKEDAYRLGVNLILFALQGSGAAVEP